MIQVHYNGVCYRLRVKPGPEGFASFNRQLQRITGLQALDCMQITFQCRAPESSQELNFKGITAFDAGKPGHFFVWCKDSATCLTIAS